MRQSAVSILLCITAAMALNQTASAETMDADIYQRALKLVIEHEKPASFAIFDRQISPAAMTTSRVPRHEPDGQFVRSLPGLNKSLEKALVAADANAGDGNVLQAFDAASSGARFAGFVDRSAIRQAELRHDRDFFVLGFSKVAYGDQGRDAVVYTEVCLVSREDVCGGEGFWYAKSRSGWQLKKRAYLWGGGSQPFWTMQ